MKVSHFNRAFGDLVLFLGEHANSYSFYSDPGVRACGKGDSVQARAEAGEAAAGTPRFQGFQLLPVTTFPAAA